MMNMSFKIVLLVMCEVILTFNIFSAFALLIKVLCTKLLVNRKHLSDVSDTEEDINDINNIATPDAGTVNNHIETTEGPVWLYGIQKEHKFLYQYQLTNVRNAFMTMTQSEAPALQPYTPVFNDPTYSHCLDTEDCQTSMVGLENNSNGFCQTDNASLDAEVIIQETEMCVDTVQHGISGFHASPFDYQVHRNVMDFGSEEDGITDDTSCINTAISCGDRCGINCIFSTIVLALIYFPSGCYLISWPIIMYYYSQLVGNTKNPSTLVAAPGFNGTVLDSNLYGAGRNWYTNQSNFFWQVGNFFIDMTQTSTASENTGIHWQVAQVTFLIKIHFFMNTAPGRGHRGVYLENDSGSFMSDMKFSGGRYADMLDGNQQFSSINMDFDEFNTAIYMNWTPKKCEDIDDANQEDEIAGNEKAAKVIEKSSRRISRIPIGTSQLKEIIRQRFERRKQLRESPSRIPVRTSELTKIIFNRMVQLKNIRRNTKILEKKFKKRKDMRLLCWLNQLYDDGETLLRQHNHVRI